MQTKIILSTVSAWELGDQFETTDAKKKEALREAKIAKQDGDLSENAPYQAAKDKFRTMGRIQRRLTKEMNALTKNGHVLVDPLEWASETPAVLVEIGVVVRLKQCGAENSFLIGGARDHHIPDEGDLMPIPYTSPLGKALLERESGARFTAAINGREQDLEILEIRRPSRDEIFAIFPKLREYF